jgi:hypothetical protein
MLQRPTAVFVFGALVALAASPAAAVSSAKPTATAKPAPSATPRTIYHVHVSPMCTALGKVIGPAIGKVLQSDKYIANSKPLFRDFTKASASGQSQAAQDLAVSRLETLIGPLVKNTQAVDKLLSDPYAFPKVAYSDDDQKLLQMRDQLRVVNEQQKKALDVISGFVDTEQLGELQAAGHDYDAALKADASNRGQTPNPAPTEPPAPILNAGVSNESNDPTRAGDPRYKNTGSLVGANPLNVFENAIASYQQDIQGSEQDAAKSVVAASPRCGGHVPGQPAASPSPSPALTPAPSASP